MLYSILTLILGLAYIIFVILYLKAYDKKSEVNLSKLKQPITRDWVKKPITECKLLTEACCIKSKSAYIDYKGKLIKTEDGLFNIILTSPSGNQCEFALNHYAHHCGYPLHIKYSTGDHVWFEPCGKVKLVRDSSGKYWK